MLRIEFAYCHLKQMAEGNKPNDRGGDDRRDGCYECDGLDLSCPRYVFRDGNGRSYRVEDLRAGE